MPSAIPHFDFRVDYASATDVGKLRQNNQDAIGIVPELALFAVADGMGGHAAGDIAARLAIDTVIHALRAPAARATLSRFLTDTSLAARHAVFALLRRAFDEANTAVREEARRRKEAAGMGSTLDVAVLVRDRAFLAHTGDGRGYLARSSTVIQLTHDHALHEALLADGTRRTSHPRPHRNPLVSAIGIATVTSVDTCFVELNRGDRLLLCTDGVHGTMESETTVAQLLRTGTAEDAVAALIAHASRKGGRDNATALVVDICERFVARNSAEGDPASGPVSSDMSVARHSPLLDGLPVPSVLAALAAAVEVEIPEGQKVPRLVANDLVGYIIVSGAVTLANGRVIGPSGLLFSESLVGVARDGELPLVTESARLMRLRADDFAEVCSHDVELSNALHLRLARHLARVR